MLSRHQIPRLPYLGSLEILHICHNLHLLDEEELEVQRGQVLSLKLHRETLRWKTAIPIFFQQDNYLRYTLHMLRAKQSTKHKPQLHLTVTGYLCVTVMTIPIRNP